MNEIGDEADETRDAAACLEEAMRGEEEGEDEYLSDGDGETREQNETSCGGEDAAHEKHEMDSFSGVELEEVDMVEDEVAVERDDTEEYQLKKITEGKEEEDITGEMKEKTDDEEEQNGEVTLEENNDELENNGDDIPAPQLDSSDVEKEEFNETEESLEEKEEGPLEDLSPVRSPPSSNDKISDEALVDTVIEEPLESVGGDPEEETLLEPPTHEVKQEEPDEHVQLPSSSTGTAAASTPTPMLHQMLDMSIVEPDVARTDEAMPALEKEAREEEEDEEIQILKVVTPAVRLPLRISHPDPGRDVSMQQMQPPLPAREHQMQRTSGGREVMRPPQPLQHPLQSSLQRGSSSQQGQPMMDESMRRRLTSSRVISSGGTVMISHSPILGNAPSTSGRLHRPLQDFRTPYLPPPPSHLTYQMQQSMLQQQHMKRQSVQRSVHQPPEQSMQQMQRQAMQPSLQQRQPMQQSMELSVRQSLQQLLQSNRGRRRKRVAEVQREMIVSQKEDEFCVGDHKILGLPIQYSDDSPSCWVDGKGMKVIRMDKMEYSAEVPSRERMVCLDLCRYEGSEEWSDVRKTERIISWRTEGLEYDLAHAAAAAKTAIRAPANQAPAAPEAHRMKSPRPMHHLNQTKPVPAATMIRAKPMQGQGASSSFTTQVRLAPPHSQPREIDRETHKAQVHQKIESARRHYAAAREASMLRMGQTYQIPQGDGTFKEFVLAHLPIDQARQPGFIQLVPEAVSGVPPPPPSSPPPVRIVLNQRTATSARAAAAAAPAVPTTPPMDDLATRYAQYLAQMQKHKQ